LSGIKIVDVKCDIMWWYLESIATQELSGTTVTLLYEYCQRSEEIHNWGFLQINASTIGEMKKIWYMLQWLKLKLNIKVTNFTYFIS